METLFSKKGYHKSAGNKSRMIIIAVLLIKAYETKGYSF